VSGAHVDKPPGPQYLPIRPISGSASSYSEAGGCVARQRGELVFHDRVHDQPGRHHAAGLRRGRDPTGHQILAPALSARSLLSLLCQAVHRGEMTSPAAKSGVWDLWEERHSRTLLSIE